VAQHFSMVPPATLPIPGVCGSMSVSGIASHVPAGGAAARTAVVARASDETRRIIFSGTTCREWPRKGGRTPSEAAAAHVLVLSQRGFAGGVAWRLLRACGLLATTTEKYKRLL
jgi:hypothetical protein